MREVPLPVTLGGGCRILVEEEEEEEEEEASGDLPVVSRGEPPINSRKVASHAKVDGCAPHTQHVNLKKVSDQTRGRHRPNFTDVYRTPSMST